MAWIEKAPSGKFRGCYRDAAGKTRKQSFTGKTAARAWAEQQEEAVRRGVWRDPKLGRITVAQWAAQWMDARVVEASTRANDEIRMRKILEEWGDVPVEHLTTIGLQGWIRRMVADGRAPATVHKYAQLMSTMLKAAVVERIRPENPATYLQLPVIEPGREVYLTPDEVDRLAAELEAPYDALMWLLVWVGPRFGEAVGLHVDQLDMLRGVVRIERTIVQVRGEFLLKAYPKGKRVREVPLPRDLVDILAAHLAAHPPAPCGLTHRRDEVCSGLVFRRTDGGIVSRHSLPRILRTAADRAGIRRDFTPHTLRHTYASGLVQDGVPLYDVQRVLGHASMKTTERYAHLAPGEHGRVRDSMDRRRDGGAGERDAR